MPNRTFDEFMALYNPDGTHPVTVIDAPLGTGRNTSPFIVVRSGPYTVLVNPLPQDEYLDVDLHSFVNGQRGAASVLGMTEGRRHDWKPDTGLTSAGAPAVGTVIVIVGKQGTDKTVAPGCLSAQRKADRAVMAYMVAELARGHGLAAEIQPERGKSRRTSVNVTGPHGLRVTMTFDGNPARGIRPDTYVLSWHGVEDGYRLNPAKFGDVNPYHGHKATDVARGIISLDALLTAKRFASIADGSAFTWSAGATARTRRQACSSRCWTRTSGPRGPCSPLQRRRSASTRARGPRHRRRRRSAIHHRAILTRTPRTGDSTMTSDNERELHTNDAEFAAKARAAAWDAYRDGQVTWLADEHGRIAAIMPEAVARGPRKLGDMDPAERQRVAERAMARVRAELQANAGAIGAVMDAAEAGEPGAVPDPDERNITFTEDDRGNWHEVIPGPRYTAHITAEAWQRGYAVEVDAPGPQDWDCTAYARQHQAYLARLAETQLAYDAAPGTGVTDNDDLFRDDPAAPAWVRAWQGPFTIRITREN